MYVVCVTVFVKSGHEEEFLKATEENHCQTRREQGNLRFDVLRAIDEPNRFFLYEVYTEPAAFTAHQQTPHYRQWKETVAPWMEKPRQGIKHQSLYPANEPGTWFSK